MIDSAKLLYSKAWGKGGGSGREEWDPLLRSQVAQRTARLQDAWVRPPRPHPIRTGSHLTPQNRPSRTRAGRHVQDATCKDSPLGSPHTRDIQEAGKDPVPWSSIPLSGPAGWGLGPRAHRVLGAQRRLHFGPFSTVLGFQRLPSGSDVSQRVS